MTSRQTDRKLRQPVRASQLRSPAHRTVNKDTQRHRYSTLVIICEAWVYILLYITLVFFVVFIWLSRARYIDEVCNAGGRRRHRRAAPVQESQPTCSKPETRQTVAPPSKKIQKDYGIHQLPRHPTSARRSAENSTTRWVFCSRPL